MGRGGSFCCFTLSIAYRYTIVNPSHWLRLLRLLLLLRLPRSQLHGLMSTFNSQVSPFPALFQSQLAPHLS